MTLNELNKRLGGEVSEARYARLRHMTVTGVLPVSGDRHPGRGRTVCFDETALGVAQAAELLSEIGCCILDKPTFLLRIANSPMLQSHLKAIVRAYRDTP